MKEKPLDRLNNIPVNRMAASMFFKTPEWAEAPQEVKLGVIEARLQEEKLNIEYFKKPEKLGKQKMRDRRGYTFLRPYYSDKKGEIIDIKKGVIVGYCGTVHRIKHGNYHNPNYLGKKPMNIQRARDHYWWCLLDSGEFISIKWENIKRGDRKARQVEI